VFASFWPVAAPALVPSIRAAVAEAVIATAWAVASNSAAADEFVVGTFVFENDLAECLTTGL
jgi:hypothetical protein